MHCAKTKGLKFFGPLASAAGVGLARASAGGAAIRLFCKGAAMNRKPFSGEDIQALNEQILSHDERLSNLAKRQLFESVNCPECFADSTVQEWARRIVNRVNRTMHS